MAGAKPLLVAEQPHVRLTLPDRGFNLNWCLKMSFILGVSYLIYLVVEKPGHLIARNLGRWLTLRNSPDVSPPIIQHGRR